MPETEKITLGSGKLYCLEFSGTIPTDSTIEDDDNLLGLISGGATLEYKPEFYTATDDLGLVSKTVITKEEATLKSGLITWNGDTLKKLSSTATVTTTSTHRTVKIGGAKNDDGKKYLFRFVHDDAVDGKTRITVVGKNQSGFSLAYTKDKETTVDAEIKAIPHDSDGTLIIFDEEIAQAEASTTETNETTTTETNETTETGQG